MPTDFLEELCPECAARLAASHPALARSAQWSVSPTLARILQPTGLHNLCDCQLRMALAALVIALETPAEQREPDDLLPRRLAKARAALGWPA